MSYCRSRLSYDMLFVRALVFDFGRANRGHPLRTVAVGEPALSLLKQMHPPNPAGGATTTPAFDYDAELDLAADTIRLHLPFFARCESRCTTTNGRLRLVGKTARGSIRS